METSVVILGWLVIVSPTPAPAQLVVERSLDVGQTIPDRGQYVSQILWANAGLSLIQQVTLNLALSSPTSTNPMWLGDMYASLTHGTASEGVRSATVFDYFAMDSNNSATSLTASYNFATQFDGAWLAGNRWSLLVADRAQGGVGRLDFWKLAVEGTSSAAGATMDLGHGGTVRVAEGTSRATSYADLATGSDGNTSTMEAGAAKTLDVQGVVSGAGNLNKMGLGTVALGGSSANTFSGSTTVSGGTLRLEKTSGAVAISGSSIAVNREGTLLLGAANQIGDSTQVTMAGGTLALGGFHETAGRLAVTADSIFDFGTAEGGTNTFAFADFDTAGYGGVAGLTFRNVGIGSSLVFNTNYSGNTTFNLFASKISFSDASLQSQISFSGGTTTLTMAAIPDAKIVWAAGALAMLIGWTELRRRLGNLGVKGFRG